MESPELQEEPPPLEDAAPASSSEAGPSSAPPPAEAVPVWPLPEWEGFDAAEAKLETAARWEAETHAMLLLARREGLELRDRQRELQAQNTALRSGIQAKRLEKRERSEPVDFSDVYDWVCEINKLSEVSTDGWKVRYSEAFLKSIDESEAQAVLGGVGDGASDADSDADSDLSAPPAGPSWEGAVVAVLGLFDKGKTFVLNHLTDAALPSGKKVSTKGLSFKHVVVEGTRFIILDSEGSYAPVKVESELSVVEKEMSEHFIQDVIFELADYFLCVVNDFTSLDQRYLDKLTRSLQNSKKVFKEVIVVHNCKTVMEKEVLDHVFETQVTHIYGSGKLQSTRVAAVNSAGGLLEEHDVQWCVTPRLSNTPPPAAPQRAHRPPRLRRPRFKTDFSRHVILANKDCPLGEETNPWVFALLRYWLKAVFVPINRRFSVLQSVLQSCNARLSSYFKAHPQLTVENTKETKLKLIKAVTRRQEGMRFAQTSVDASGLLLARPNSFQPAIDIIRDSSYTIYMDVPGLTKKDLQLSRQNITTIVKGFRSTPYHELQTKVEKCERKYGDFTQAFKIPQEYERKWHSCTIENGVMKIVFRQDQDEEALQLQDAERRAQRRNARDAQAALEEGGE